MTSQSKPELHAGLLTTWSNKPSGAVSDPKLTEEETFQACGNLGSPHVIVLLPHIMILSQQTASVHSSETKPPPPLPSTHTHTFTNTQTHTFAAHHYCNLRPCGLERRKHNSVYIHDFWEREILGWHVCESVDSSRLENNWGFHMGLFLWILII